MDRISHGVIAASGPALVGNVALDEHKEDPMATFVGLDVSLKATSVCVLDESGAGVFEGKAPTDPAVLARLIRKRAPEVVRVGLESGPTSAWLFHALTAAGVPAVCLDARHAQAALSVRPTSPTRTTREVWRKWSGWAGFGRSRSRARPLTNARPC